MKERDDSWLYLYYANDIMVNLANASMGRLHAAAEMANRCTVYHCLGSMAQRNVISLLCRKGSF